MVYFGENTDDQEFETLLPHLNAIGQIQVMNLYRSKITEESFPVIDRLRFTHTVVLPKEIVDKFGCAELGKRFPQLKIRNCEE